MERRESLVLRWVELPWSPLNGLSRRQHRFKSGWGRQKQGGSSQGCSRTIHSPRVERTQLAENILPGGSRSELSQTQLLREHFGQIVVDDVDADLLGALAGVAEFFLQIFHHEADVALDFFIVGLERFLIEFLDRTAEVFVFEEGVEHLLLEIVDIAFVEVEVETGCGNVQVVAEDFLGQGGAGVGFLHAAAEGQGVGGGHHQPRLDPLEKGFADLQPLAGEPAGFRGSRLEVDREHVVLDVLGDLLLVVIIERFFDRLQHRVVVHPQQGIEKAHG